MSVNFSISMQIRPNIYSKNNFGATRLYQVYLREKQKDGNYKNIPASFTELCYFDNKDIALVDQIRQRWIAQDFFASYANAICHNFILAPEKVPMKRFFAIQLDNSELDEYSKTTALLETSNPDFYPKKHLEINYLQSASSILPGFAKNNIIGSGEQAVYGATKFAKERGIKNIRIFSTNDSFYEKLGIHSKKRYNVGTYYVLQDCDCEAFLRRVEEKYSD